MFRKRLYPLEYIGILLGTGTAAVLFPAFVNNRPLAGCILRPSCQSNLKQIGLAMAQYGQDYDAILPSTTGSGGTYGWADSLLPYLKNAHILQCPSDKSGAQDSPQSSGYTDYWFNARLSGRNSTSIGSAAQTILSGEGNDGHDLTDARYSIAALPVQWINDSQSPLYRHLQYGNYLFADGHAKSIKPDRVTTTWSPNHFYFVPLSPYTHR